MSKCFSRRRSARGMVNGIVRLSEVGRVMDDGSGCGTERVWGMGSTMVRLGPGRVQEMRMVSGTSALRSGESEKLEM
jgi:hypothetical protein